jgi:hypothetical protein
MKRLRLLLGLIWLAAPAAGLAAGAIAQSFSTTSSDITAGTILSLTSQNGVVEPATSSGKVLAGVATSKPVLELSSGGTHSVQVAVGGTAQVLVSDINGDVLVGDKIAASPITGVGMKAVSSAEIVGTAQSSLGSVPTVKRSVTDLAGKQTDVKVGLVPVSVNVEFYAASSGSALSAFVPPFLQNLANAISGKEVSPLRVIVGLLVLLAGTVAVIIMLTTAIKSGIISIGRNPLAEGALRKGLIDVLLAAIGVLFITTALVYGIVTS